MIAVTTKPDTFKPTVISYKIGHNIMFVACDRPEGTWKAYAGIVAGKSHDIEANTVLATGDVVIESIARAIFDQFCDLPYAS